MPETAHFRVHRRVLVPAEEEVAWRCARSRFDALPLHALHHHVRVF
eukprot:CAMPEP_0202848484 /NCGR_PEP_ID=MMETSP1389-20130828/78239_1 /ASSEMBLY_ACC=CAM_ASM_000865 /TAXON_ID=302021 /ORGANISM="Rhodomonas sp., Strain CCMP768" /LENGTH=45 /DNA_ID= /DNA_START= /DNA_END= /DNA_ORIENTATION=